jgi:mannose/fructose/N-acetylgalactosamine-specific phosphotransferase system component IIB
MFLLDHLILDNTHNPDFDYSLAVVAADTVAADTVAADTVAVVAAAAVVASALEILNVALFLPESFFLYHSMVLLVRSLQQICHPHFTRIPREIFNKMKFQYQIYKKWT